MSKLQIYPYWFSDKKLDILQGKSFISHTDANEEGDGNLRQGVSSQHMNISCFCWLVSSLMQELRTAIPSTITCDQFQRDFEQNIKLTTRQKLFNAFFFVIAEVSFCPPGPEDIWIPVPPPGVRARPQLPQNWCHLREKHKPKIKETHKKEKSFSLISLEPLGVKPQPKPAFWREQSAYFKAALEVQVV